MKIKSPSAIFTIDDTILRSIFRHYHNRLAAKVDVLVAGSGVGTISDQNGVAVGCRIDTSLNCVIFTGDMNSIRQCASCK
ncbi:hypothetical protein ISS30_10215 [bacterium]|nr:hypothetical protein [bacterium]